MLNKSFLLLSSLLLAATFCQCTKTAEPLEAGLKNDNSQVADADPPPGKSDSLSLVQETGLPAETNDLSSGQPAKKADRKVKKDQPKPQKYSPVKKDAKQQQVVFDKKVAEQLGADLTEVLQKATRLQAYRLNPLAEEVKAENSFKGWETLEKTDSIAVNLQLDLLRLLTKAENYLLGKSVKMCLFLPDVAYIFSDSKGRSVEVFVSAHCKEVGFFFGDREVYEDCDPSIDQFKQLQQLIFHKP